MTNSIFQVITVTLNPAVDQTVIIPHFTAGAVNRVESVRSNAGGKGVNVASALADYGHRVAATGFLGRENAAIFEGLLQSKDIADHFVRLPGQTRMGIKITDTARGETTDINYPGIAPSPQDLETLRDQFRELSALEPAWIVLAGSVPPGIDPSIYRELTQLFREGGNKVVLDASGEPLRLALEAVPHIVKPNIHELEELVGQPLQTREALVDAARSFIARGTALVAVSMGADGALFVTADEVVVARPPSVPVRSTVGAGDAMVAGIVAGQLRELPLTECARLATAFSLDALVRGESGITSHAAIEAFQQEVTIQ
jgi:1-phosphofructokinase